MLLSRFNTIKLCDLISESLFRKHYDKFYQTSYPYMSPEHETFTKSSDIWFVLNDLFNNYMICFFNFILKINIKKKEI